jgi:hypothetical protein
VPSPQEVFDEGEDSWWKHMLNKRKEANAEKES